MITLKKEVIFDPESQFQDAVTTVLHPDWLVGYLSLFLLDYRGWTFDLPNFANIRIRVSGKRSRKNIFPCFFVKSSHPRFVNAWRNQRESHVKICSRLQFLLIFLNRKWPYSVAKPPLRRYLFLKQVSRSHIEIEGNFGFV